MKNKEHGKTKAYRAIKAEIQAYKTAKNAKPYDEAAEIALLKKMAKQRADSIHQFISAGREDLANLEGEELSYIHDLIPEEASEEQILKWLKDNNYESIDQKEMGAVVKEVKANLPTADGKTVARIVKSLIK